MLVHPAIVGLTFRQTLARRGWLLSFAVIALPIAMSLLTRMYATIPEDPASMVVGGLSGLILTGIVPLVALIFANAALGGEVDDGTITYLLTKPIPRWKIVTSKFFTTALVASLCGGLATLGSAYVAMQGFDDTRLVIAFTVAAMLGCTLYTAIFLALSLITRRGMLTGLVYLIVWEGALSGIFAGTRVLSVRQYMLSVADRITTVDPEIFTAQLPIDTAYRMIVVVGIGALALCIYRLREFELGQVG